MIYLKNRSCCLASRSQVTSKCGKNRGLTHELQASVSLMFDVFCDLLLNRRMQNGIYLLNRHNSLEIVGFERLGFHFKKTRIIQSLLYSLLVESFRFCDEDEGERYSVLSSALP